jgi:hypothetical protein
MALATAQRQEQLVDEMAKRRFAVASAERFSWRSLSDAIVRPGRRSAGGK